MVSPKRSKKEPIKIKQFRGSLRLRWSFEGKRHGITVGDVQSQIQAQALASRIEKDMRNGVFDPTLSKYQPGHSKPNETLDPFNIGHHYKKWLDSTIQKEPTAHVIYTQNMVNKWGSTNFPDVADRLHSQGSAPKTFNNRKNVLKRFVKWLVKKKNVSENPLKDVASQRVKIKRPQRIAFRDAKIAKILAAFANNAFGTTSYPHKHYKDFIRFLFMIGCRNAETIGLTVGKVNFVKSEIMIDESLARQANQTHRKAIDDRMLHRFRWVGLLFHATVVLTAILQRR